MKYEATREEKKNNYMLLTKLNLLFENNKKIQLLYYATFKHPFNIQMHKK